MTREESIEIIQKLIGRFKSDSRTYKALDMAIQALSQEPCDDAISREAALEKMADYVASGYADSAEDFEEYSRIICQLPPVTPKPIECDDAISRQAVLDLINADWKYEGLEEPVSSLPPVTQKSGKWILLDECANSGYYCSNCQKKLVKEGWSNTVKKIKYCPNCGAKMESEDKG